MVDWQHWLTPPCGPAPTICCTGCCCCSCCCGCCLPLEVEPPLPSTKFHARNKVETKLKIVKEILHWLGFLHLIKGVFPYLRNNIKWGSSLAPFWKKVRASLWNDRLWPQLCFSPLFGSPWHQASKLATHVAHSHWNTQAEFCNILQPSICS